MANREESDAAEHETFPGTGALRGEELRRGIHPVEQMVDAAIERLAREQGTSALAPTAFVSAAGTRGDALALASREGQGLAVAPRRPGRLRWKGLEVSEEFRSYAERVARGEDLPPFTGKILAAPDAAFPWQPGARPGVKRRQSLRQQLGLWAGSALLIGGIGWSIFSTLRSLDSDPLQRGESPLATAVFSNKPGSEASLDSDPKPALSEQIATSSGSVGTASLGTESGDDTDVANAKNPANASRGSLTEKAPLSPPATAALSKPGEAPKAAVSAPPPGVNQKTAPGTPAAAQAAAPHAYIGLASADASKPAAAVGASKPALGGGITLSPAPGSAATTSSPHAESPVPVISPPSNPSATAGAVAAGTPSDSKKEPGSESSAKGALLVETPSF